MTDTERIREELHELVADVLEIEPDELTPDGGFVDVYEVDSLLAIEMVARIDMRYGTELSVQELARMTDLRSVQDVVLQHLNGG
ncbi:MAG TPA: acyl carrier protein [Mycobacteriales bacterium]|nr:acyl carrier protein [Mycobacteriales bacterium]